MGFAIIYDSTTLRPLEILGDRDKALRSLGLPHTTPEGRRVTRTELDETERYDSGDQTATERSVAHYLPQSS